MKRMNQKTSTLTRIRRLKFRPFWYVSVVLWEAFVYSPRAFVIRWYKKLTAKFSRRFIPLTPLVIQRARVDSSRAANSYPGPLTVEGVTTMIHDAQVRGGELQGYLDEKLSPSQIRWIDHKRHCASESYEVGQRGCIQLVLHNISFRYWDVVVLPGLKFILKQWDRQMFYQMDRMPSDETKLQRITLNVWMYNSPYKVKEQHLRPSVEEEEVLERRTVCGGTH